ncbi:alpha/beta-hydrolase [Auricularia subglabra TFB-10046 SS5]|nr:alpha/beta-hydrolase [Auricularia subglabra TFB-10046 SS5]
MADGDLAIHASEREYNFRELDTLLASPSSYTLTAADLTPGDIVSQLASIGEFAEIAKGSVDPDFILANRAQLTQPGFPLEGYSTLADLEQTAHCISVFHSESPPHQGYVALLPKRRTIVLAYSSTASLAVATKLMRAWRTPHHEPPEHFPDLKPARVHSGFQQIYLAMRDKARAALVEAFHQLPQQDNDDLTVIITGHSLGGALSYFSIVDLLHDILRPVKPEDVSVVPWRIRPPTFHLAVYGAPRPGNAPFADHYAKLVASYRSQHGAASLTDWCVIGHRDGVPSLPPYMSPMCEQPFYLYHGDLYNVPASERAHTKFTVIRDDSRPPRFIRGGHNYYNVRDMEGSVRRLRAIREDVERGCSADEWARRYVEREEVERQKQLSKTSTRDKLVRSLSARTGRGSYAV